MQSAKDLLVKYGSDLEAMVLHEFPDAAFPGPAQAFVKLEIEVFAMGERALPDSSTNLRTALEGQLRGRVASYDSLHSLYWQQKSGPDLDAVIEGGELVHSARLYCPEVFRRRGVGLLTYISKYDRAEKALARPIDLPQSASLPPDLSEDEHKQAWYIFEAILEFLLLIAEGDPTLATWDEYAKRPGTRRDRLGRVLKDRVKYTPENLDIIRQMRSMHGWDVVWNIGQVLDDRRYTHVEGISLSSVERATYSQILSVLQGCSGGVHVWPKQIGLLVKIARGKARDYAKEELRKRGITVPLAWEPMKSDDIWTDSEEIEQVLAGAEEIGLGHLFSTVDSYRSQSSGIDGNIIESITQGRSTGEIVKELKTTRARVYAVARHFEEFLEQEIACGSSRP